MNMVRAPAITNSMDRPPMEPSQIQPPQRNPSPAVNAYLNHLQSKKSSSGIDPRQTIASPVLRSKAPVLQQPRQQPSSVNASTFTPSPPNTDVKSISTRNKSNLSKILPRSTHANSTCTPQGGKQRRPRKGRRSEGGEKPPLGSQQKHPRSTLSEATNSTYLSSDSDEDASTATATVHSDGTSSFHSSHSTTGGARYRYRKSRSEGSGSPRSGSSPSNFPDRHHRDTSQSDNALVPYQPNESYGHSYSHDHDVHGKNRSGGSSNHYFNEHHRSTRYNRYDNEINSDMHHNHEDAEDFSYSDEDDYYYRQQMEQPLEHELCHYNNSFQNDNDDNDALAVDLDKLIEEASARWKLTVSETVQSTATSTVFASSTPFVSPLLQREFNNVAVNQRSVVNASVPTVLVDDNHVPATSSISQNVSLPDIVVSATPSSSRLIQEQRSEIEALRAELQKHQQLTSKQILVPSNPIVEQHLPSKEQQQVTPPPPVHPIQVLTVATDHQSTVEDDLTVWSGFHSMSAPPPLQQHRPDADAGSVVAENNPYQKPFQNYRPTGVPPPRPQPTSSLRTLQLELSSIVTGITRSAIFTGTVTSTAAPTTDAFTTLANISVTGTGVLQFIETGDVYRGDIVHSEMHGYGTYTYGASSCMDKRHKQQEPLKVLRGRFEHNVFIGD